MIARPGPYINAETTGGGFPAWLKRVPGRARTSAPGYTAAYRDWLTHINPIIARHQVTRGGPVLLYNVENEYAANTDADYMQDLQDLARAAGIDVPITTNSAATRPTGARRGDPGRAPCRSPASTTTRRASTAPNAATVWGPAGAGVTERHARRRAGLRGRVPGGRDRPAERRLRGVPRADRAAVHEVLPEEQPDHSGRHRCSTTTWASAAPTGAGSPSRTTSTPPTTTARRSPRRASSPTKYEEFKRQGYFLRAVARRWPRPTRRPRPRRRRAGDRGPGQPRRRHPVRAGAQRRAVDGLVHPRLDDAGRARTRCRSRVPGHDAKVLVGGLRPGRAAARGRPPRRS